jgi:hypothetical protein
MNKLPGMLGEVGFGGVDDPLPDWRENPAETEDEDDRPLTRGERKALTGMLGFDPAELEGAE